MGVGGGGDAVATLREFTSLMDVGAFVADLLRALADTELFERVDLSTEGPIVEGYAYVQRGWHLHPVDDPADHVAVEPLSVLEIIARLRDVLES